LIVTGSRDGWLADADGLEAGLLADGLDDGCDD
jgi:hypothetical protein